MSESNYLTIEPECLPDMSLCNESHVGTPQLKLDLLSEPLQEWLINTADSASAPVDYTFVALLITAASIIGNRGNIQLRLSWFEPAILWGAIVGAPSQGKTPAIKPVISSLNNYQSHINQDYDYKLEAYNIAAETAKAYKKKWESECNKTKSTVTAMPNEALPPKKPARERLIVQDTTIEKLYVIHKENPNGFLQYRDEISGWLGNMSRYKGGSGSDEPFWLESYTNSTFVVDRINKEDSLEISQVSVSILGGIQPDKVKALIKTEDTGLSARFLYTWPQSVPLKYIDREVDHNFLINLYRRLRENPSGTIPINKTAKDPLFKFEKYCRNKAQRYKGVMASLFGKAAGTSGRIAYVLTMIQWGITNSEIPPREVSKDTMALSIKLMKEYFLPMALKVIDSSGEMESEGYGRILAKFILNKKLDRINKRDIYKKHRVIGLNNAKKAQMAIDELAESNWLYPNTDRTNNKKDYLVNPTVYKKGAAG